MHTIVCLPGDGIGPEVVAAMKRVVKAAGVEVDWQDMPAGLGSLEKYGEPLPAATLVAIEAAGIAIKGPTNTPQGKGFTSVNVALRQQLDLYMGIRPFRELPFPDRRESPIDIVLIRENTEGLYSCGETIFDDERGKRVTLTCSFTDAAMRRLTRRALPLAQREGKHMTIVTKSNIHKKWGRLYIDAFHETAQEMAQECPDVVTSELLVDATGMLVTSGKLRSGYLITENMFGDILSDVLAGLVGGLGVAPGANIGDTCALFEAVHGSADDIAGKDLANPLALILSAVDMLHHIGEQEAAASIRTAVERIVAEGKAVTGDMAWRYSANATVVGTMAFTDHLIDAMR